MEKKTPEELVSEFQSDHDKDRMGMEETYKWLEQMKLEAPTQQDLGKDVIYQND